MMIFGVCFVLYLIKLSAGKGFSIFKSFKIDKNVTESDSIPENNADFENTA